MTVEVVSSVVCSSYRTPRTRILLIERSVSRRCVQGWAGESCNVCEKRQHCEHGDCDGRNAYSCSCHAGWRGKYCNIGEPLPEPRLLLLLSFIHHSAQHSASLHRFSLLSRRPSRGSHQFDSKHTRSWSILKPAHTSSQTSAF